MLEGPALEKAIRAILSRLGEINTAYIKKIAAQIKKIGGLNATSVNRLLVMRDMGADIFEINEELRIATAVNNATLAKIYERALEESIADQRFREYLAQTPQAITPEAKQRLVNFTRAVYRQTAGNLVNLSNTTALTPMYVEAVDKAILAT